MGRKDKPGYSPSSFFNDALQCVNIFLAFVGTGNFPFFFNVTVECKGTPNMT